MLVLFETPAGFALFKLRKGAVVSEVDMADDFATPEKANEMVRQAERRIHFQKDKDREGERDGFE